MTLLNKKDFALTLLLVSCFFPASCAKQTPPFSSSVSAVTIDPSYQQLAQKSLTLASNSERLCADYSLDEKEFNTLRFDWKEAMLAWEQAEVIRFGPIENNNTRWQFQFWPDKHNNTGKKVKALLQSEEELNTAHIDSAGVVVQGFSALEFLLFDAQNPPAIFSATNLAAKQRCLMLTLVSRKIATTASVLSGQWQKNGQFRAVFDNPAKDNATYASESATILAVLDSVVFSLEVIIKDKLATPLGLDTPLKKTNVFASEAWRSGESLEFIRANVVIIHQLLASPKAGILNLLDSDSKNKALAERIRQQLNTVQDFLAQIRSPYAELLKTDKGKASLLKLHDDLESLLKLCSGELPQALGITLSFNGKDGD